MRCSECGNRFKKIGVVLGDVVVCPSCEAQYKVVVAKDGNLCLADFVFDGTDPGEL